MCKLPPDISATLRLTRANSATKAVLVLGQAEMRRSVLRPEGGVTVPLGRVCAMATGAMAAPARN